MRKKSRNAGAYVRLSLMCAFIGIGAYLVRASDSLPGLNWMRVYNASDFVGASFSGIVTFFANLRIPIPPIIALLEITSIKTVGSAILVTRYGYRVALVGSYAAAIWLAGTSTKRMMVAFLVSVLFLYGTTKIHAANPQNYDIFLPLFFLSFLGLLQRASSARRISMTQVLSLACLSGLFLSMTELTRPFIIYLMPLLVVSAYFALVPTGRKMPFVAFIFPILLISGVWHGYLLLSHHQFTFSNNSGFNVGAAWPQIPRPALLPELHNAPLAPGRWPNLNTEEHAVNSSRFQQAQVRYWLTHILDSLLYAIKRVDVLLTGGTQILRQTPESRWLGLYTLLVRMTSSSAILSAAILTAEALTHPYHIPSILSKPDNIIVVFTVCCAVLLAVGERGEEARFLLSILPCLATLPIYRSPGQEPALDTKHSFGVDW